MSDDQPQDPLTGLAEAAISVHQLYCEYRDAGFTIEQAFELVKVVLATSLRPAP